MSESEKFTVADAHRYGERAVELALEHAGLELNFSIESLETVDGLMAGWHDDGNTCESMPTTVYLFGCYLGEVLIRNHGGAWQENSLSNEEMPIFPVVIELPNKTICNPISKACKLLDNGLGDSLLFFYQVTVAMQ